MGESDEATVPVEELNKLQSDYDDLKTAHDKLQTDYDNLKKEKDALEEKYKDIDPDDFKAMKDRLADIEKEEKTKLIKDITERAKDGAWDQKELEEMDLERLKLILKALDSIEPTTRFKGIRPGAAAVGRTEGGLTVGDLYHKPFENPPVPSGGGS